MNEDEIDLWKQISNKADKKFVTMSESGKEILDADNYAGRPVLGKILILPRSSVPELVVDKRWALISISDPMDKGRMPENDANLVDMIHLQFDDVEFTNSSSIPITEEQAQEILAFAKKNWEDVDLLVIHCNAGISRSPAVGRVLSEIYQPEFAKYFDDFYSPNRLVRKVFAEAIQNAEES